MYCVRSTCVIGKVCCARFIILCDLRVVWVSGTLDIPLRK